MAPVVTPLDRFDFKAAGRGSSDRTAPILTEQTSPWKEENLSGREYSEAPPREVSCNHSAVLSLLPRMPGLPDEAFMLLYLDASREFERRIGASGWYDRVLALAARGR